MAQVEVKVKLDLPPGVELLGYERSGDGHCFEVKLPLPAVWWWTGFTWPGGSTRWSMTCGKKSPRSTRPSCRTPAA